MGMLIALMCPATPGDYCGLYVFLLPAEAARQPPERTCAFAAGLVDDLIHNVAGGPWLVVLLFEDDGRDLNQKRFQLSVVPIIEGGGQLLVSEAAQGLENVVCLRDELHTSKTQVVYLHSVPLTEEGRFCSYLLHPSTQRTPPCLTCVWKGSCLV
jgi:hypothetical protein